MFIVRAQKHITLASLWLRLILADSESEDTTARIF